MPKNTHDFIKSCASKLGEEGSERFETLSFENGVLFSHGVPFLFKVGNDVYLNTSETTQVLFTDYHYAAAYSDILIKLFHDCEWLVPSYLDQGKIRELKEILLFDISDDRQGLIQRFKNPKFKEEKEKFEAIRNIRRHGEMIQRVAA